MHLAQLKKAAQHHRHSSSAIRWVLRLGAVGLFFVAIVDSSVVPLPVPGSTDLFLLLLASRDPDHWWIYSLVSIAGAFIGGYASYRLSAKGGERLMERFVSPRIRTRVERWVCDHPFLSIGVPALLPPPIPLTPFVIASGATAMPKRKFILAFMTARTIRYLLDGWLAHHYGKHIVRWWNHYLGEYTEPIIWTLIAITVVGGLFFYFRFLRQKSAAVPATAGSRA